MITSSGLQFAGSAIEIERELGRGGMGRVWLASRAGAAGFARRVVVKEMLRPRMTDLQRRERFQREAALIARLKHPNIIDVVDFAEVGSTFFMVMEYLPGKDLAAALAGLDDEGRARLVGASVRVVADVANALAYAHDFTDPTGQRHRIVHRDVTPDNILIGWHDEVKLIDFGVAKDLDMVSMTHEGEVLGKPLYLPPECIKGGAPTIAWDIYGLGVTLYLMLAGRMPFFVTGGRRNLLAIANDIVKQAPAPLRALNPAVSDALAEIVARAMAKEPSDRYPTAAALREDLEALLRTLPAEMPVAPRLLLGPEPPPEALVPGPKVDADAAPGLAHTRTSDGGSDSHDAEPVTGDDGAEEAEARDRQQEQELELEDVREEQRSLPWWRRWLWALLLVWLVAVVGLVGFLLLRRDSIANVAAPVPVAEPIEPAPANGRIVIKCGSWGYIHVDGRVIGLCPVDPVEVAAGTHTVSAEGRKGTRSREVLVEPGTEVVVDFRSPRKPSVGVTVPVVKKAK